jgi:carbonic anhydrase/acetyltransferase-like protein (isoleucine patch superfamily)
MAAVILPVNDKLPVIPDTCFLAPNATVVGDVEFGERCSVWFNAVVRGDVNFIRIGNDTNIQDNAVIHCTYQKAGTTIGSQVSVGHSAIIHGCTLNDHVLVGMGAIIMDQAVVEEFCIIAAGAVVLENTRCLSGYLYAGIPAKCIKALTGEQIELLRKLPSNYTLYASWFKAEAEE